jgi:hypothetical protein
LIKLLIGVGLAFTITYLASFTMNSAHRIKVIEIMSDKAAAECLEKISRNNSLLFTPINRKSLNCTRWLPYLTDRAISKLDHDRLKIIGERAGRGLYVEVQKMDEAEEEEEEEEIANGTLVDYVEDYNYDADISISADLIATDMETDEVGGGGGGGDEGEGEGEGEEEEEEEKEG